MVALGWVRPGLGRGMCSFSSVGSGVSSQGKLCCWYCPMGKGWHEERGKKGLGVTFCSMLSLVINCVFRETLGGLGEESPVIAGHLI